MVKICFSLGDTDNALKFYNELLTYTTRAVTRNYSEKSINNILDKISLSSDTAFMERFYNITLTALEEQQNERLWLKTNLKLAKLWLDRKEYGRLNKILRLLHKACQNEEGEDDQSKGTHLLEVYAIEIQMYTETKNNKKLKVRPGEWGEIDGIGIVQQVFAGQVGDSSSADYGRYPRMWWENAHV
jgi:COP9 signalosome complex subunit 2